MKKTYIIDEGHHYVRWYQMIPCFHYNLQSLSFSFKPEKSWYWYPARDHNDKDINKLFGLGFGWSHHKDSIRIGWRPDFENLKYIEYFAYWYDGGGNHQRESFGIFHVNQKMAGAFSGLQQKTYVIQLNSNVIQVPNLTPDKKWGMYLRPYIGGDNSAIHQFKFNLSWKGHK